MAFVLSPKRANGLREPLNPKRVNGLKESSSLIEAK